jgi:hypothetical protein
MASCPSGLVVNFESKGSHGLMCEARSHPRDVGRDEAWVIAVERIYRSLEAADDFACSRRHRLRVIVAPLSLAGAGASGRGNGFTYIVIGGQHHARACGLGRRLAIVDNRTAPDRWIIVEDDSRHQSTPRSTGH